MPKIYVATVYTTYTVVRVKRLLEFVHFVFLFFFFRNAPHQNFGHYSPNLQALCNKSCRSQWPRGLRRRSAAARLLRSWIRIPPGAWMFVCCECCVLSGRGLCDELINRPEESYRFWWVVVCDPETSRMRRPWPALGRSATAKKKKVLWCIVDLTFTNDSASQNNIWQFPPILYFTSCKFSRQSAVQYARKRRHRCQVISSVYAHLINKWVG